MNKLCVIAIQIVHKPAGAARSENLSTPLHRHSTACARREYSATTRTQWIFAHIPSYRATY